MVGALALLTVAVTGCGGDDSGDQTVALAQADAAASPSMDAFPPAKGKSLRELAGEATAGLEVAPATQNFTPGKNRFAFGLIDKNGQGAYAPTAVYVAQSPGSPASGPFPAPTDSLITDAAFQSRNAATEQDPFASVYESEVDLPKAGPWAVLVLSEVGTQKLVGATTQLEVKPSDSVPAPGDKAPVTDTDTLEEAGDITKIDTRVPPDSMHDTNLADVIGEKPVALLFATPALCQSRVCGPVTDIAEQLKAEYGDQIEFIHQEVYVDNDPSKGIRPPLSDYNLKSEPWLFTIDADGNVAARLEGSFGVNAFEDAIQQAIEQ